MKETYGYRKRRVTVYMKKYNRNSIGKKQANVGEKFPRRGYFCNMWLVNYVYTDEKGSIM